MAISQWLVLENLLSTAFAIIHLDPSSILDTTPVNSVQHQIFRNPIVFRDGTYVIGSKIYFYNKN